MNILVFSVLGVIISASLRIFDYVVFFDKTSGFFSNNGALSYAALAVPILLCIIFFIIGKKKACEYSYQGTEKIPFAIVSALSSVGFFYGATEIFFEYSVIEGSGTYEATAMGISMRAPVMIFSVLMGAFAVCSAFDSFKGLKIFEKAPVVALIPPLWAMLFTLFVFMHYSVSPLQSENIFAVLPCVFASYAFLQYAFTVSGLSTKRINKLRISGLCFIITALSYSVSGIIKTGLGFNVKSDVPLYVYVMLIFAALYMLSFLLTIKNPESTSVYKAKRFRKQ